ncbi:nickel transporter [Lactiplantibacillus plantarum]|nr:nickel transporter [Lactiplantibacillus plantarum]
MQTALEIVRFNDIPLKVELGLHEWLPDETGSRTDTDEQAATAYKLYRQHAGKRTTASPRPYESAAEMKARVLATLNKYAASYDCIACVTHGEVMRQFGNQKDVDYCGVRVIAVD